MDQELRKSVQKSVQNHEISIQVGRDQRTVRRWLTRWQNNETTDNLPRSGRIAKLSESQQVKLLNYIQTNLNATLNEIKSALELNCCTRTINNYLKRNKVHSFKADKKPSHFPVRLKARLSFAKIIKSSFRQWNNVIFSDKSSFRNHRSCARYVWRQRGVEPPAQASSFAATRDKRINVWGQYRLTDLSV